MDAGSPSAISTIDIVRYNTFIMSVERNRAELVFNPNPKVDRSKCPSSEVVRESVFYDASRLLPPFIGRINRQRGLDQIAQIRVK